MTVRARIERIALLNFVPPAALDPEQNPLLGLPRMNAPMMAAALMTMAVIGVAVAWVVGVSAQSPASPLFGAGLILCVCLSILAPGIGASFRTRFERHPARSDLPLLPLHADMVIGLLARPIAWLMLGGFCLSLLVALAALGADEIPLFLAPLLAFNFALGLGIRAMFLAAVEPGKRLARLGRTGYLLGILLLTLLLRLCLGSGGWPGLLLGELVVCIARLYWFRAAVEDLSNASVECLSSSEEKPPPRPWWLVPVDPQAKRRRAT